MISIPCLIAADLDCSQNSGSRTGISFISFFFSNNEALNADQEISELCSLSFNNICFSISLKICTFHDIVPFQLTDEIFFKNYIQKLRTKSTSQPSKSSTIAILNVSEAEYRNFQICLITIFIVKGKLCC